MITIQGKGVSTGIGMGPLYFYRRAKTEIKRYTVEDKQAEWLRFKGAQAVAMISWASWLRRQGQKPVTKQRCCSRPIR